MALSHPGTHFVLNSYDIKDGANTFLMVWGTDTFRKANPQTYKAVLGALKEATTWINDNKQAAAELYVNDVQGKAAVAKIAKLITEPQIQYTLTPEQVHPCAQYMTNIGTFKNEKT